MIGHGVPGLDIRQQHDFATSDAALFHALTQGIDEWWPPDTRLTGPLGRLSLVAEPGAVLIERGPGGAAVIWGTVDAVEPERRLYLNGWFGVQGAVAGRVHFDVTGIASGARLTLLHQAIGPVPEDMNTRHRATWRRILDGALRAYLSGTPV
ncbi:MAG: SRPBCC family protein [Pararhodobacter sp.]